MLAVALLSAPLFIFNTRHDTWPTIEIFHFIVREIIISHLLEGRGFEYYSSLIEYAATRWLKKYREMEGHYWCEVFYYRFLLILQNIMIKRTFI